MASRRQENAKRLTWYQCKGEVPPTPQIKTWPGLWMSTNDTKFCSDNAISFSLDSHNMSLKSVGGEGSEVARRVNSIEVFYDPFNGLSCGEMLSFGDPDLPAEQVWSLYLNFGFLFSPWFFFFASLGYYSALGFTFLPP